MSKVLVYLLLILFYLGVSKSLNPSRNNTLFIKDKYALANYFNSKPMSVILIDVKEVGLFMKTYLQKFLIIEGFDDSMEIVVKTPKKYFLENKKYIGLSVLRRSEQSNYPSFTPMPPGILFMGDPSYGYWRRSKAGIKKWYFYRAYKQLPKILAYGTYRPTHSLLRAARVALKKDLPFFGINKEFGPTGSITQKYLKSRFFQDSKKKFDIKELLKQKFRSAL